MFYTQNEPWKFRFREIRVGANTDAHMKINIVIR